jgi:hypothetical protein
MTRRGKTGDLRKRGKVEEFHTLVDLSMYHGETRTLLRKTLGLHPKIPSAV